MPPFWHPRTHADRRPALLARNRIQGAIRGWLTRQDFIEVDPCALQISPGNEVHLHAFATDLVDITGTIRRRYLHTSPEFAMKKLLAAGEGRIAAFAHVWRNNEGGPRHSAEFTMLEWYRVGADYTVLMEDCAVMLRLAAEAAGANVLRQGAATCDPFADPERLSMAEAFDRYAGIDLLATCNGDGSTDPEGLRAQCAMAGVAVSDDDSWADMFSKILHARVDDHLGHGRPTILDRYPVAQAALARPAADDPRVAERFELHVCGLELANGFGELTDAAEQRRRFQADMDLKEALYGTRYPIDEDFLAALEIMPDASGVAMGFDRLIMLATGAPRITDVLWVPAG